MSITALPDLELEGFGDKLRRMRDRSGLRLADAAVMVSAVFPVSAPTLHRLESLAEAPRDWRRQVVAYLAAVAYGFNPGGLGLPENPFPFPIDLDTVPALVRKRGQGLLPCTFGQQARSAAVLAGAEIRLRVQNQGCFALAA